MHIEVDKEADAAYIYLRPNVKVATSTEISRGIIYDYGEDGLLVGIEVLGLENMAKVALLD